MATVSDERKRGRPRSERCPACGALPCYQARPVPHAPPSVSQELPQRHFVGAYDLPDGSRRDLYMHTADGARAALAALRRDPSLVHSLQADEYEDVPAHQRRDRA